jgi:hypothetical protein
VVLYTHNCMEHYKGRDGCNKVKMRKREFESWLCRAIQPCAAWDSLVQACVAVSEVCDWSKSVGGCQLGSLPRFFVWRSPLTKSEAINQPHYALRLHLLRNILSLAQRQHETWDQCSKKPSHWSCTSLGAQLTGACNLLAHCRKSGL